MKLKFLKVLGGFAQGESYLRGKDTAGVTVRHLSGLQLYPCGPVELTVEQKALIEAQTGAELRDFVMSEGQVAELNRKPSRVHAQVITVEIEEPKPEVKPITEKSSKADVQAKARELGIEFEEKTTVKELVALIDAKLAEKPE